MAPTRPSIMSEGATMSAPGGGVRDGGAHQLIDGRVVGDLLVDDDAAVAVIGVLAQAHVGHHENVRRIPLDRADGRLDRRFRIVRQRSDVVLVIGQAEQQHALDAGLARASASFTASSTDRLNTPGIDGTSRRTPSPSQTNSGSTNMSGDRRVSRTSARMVSDWRSRRSRRVSFNEEGRAWLSSWDCSGQRRPRAIKTDTFFEMPDNRVDERGNSVCGRLDGRLDVVLRRGLGRDGTDAGDGACPP